MKYLIIAFALILFLPLISGVEMNNTIINSTGLNLTINISTPSIYFDSLTVASDSIYFSGLRSSDSSLEKLTFNITEGNKSYSGSDLPYFVSSSITNSQQTVIIQSNIGSLNISFSKTPIKSGFPTSSVKSVTLDGNNLEHSFDNNSISFDALLTPKNNSIIIDYTNNPQTNNVCTSLFAGYGVFNPWVIMLSILGIVVMVIIIGSIVYIVNKNQETMQISSVNLDLDGNMFKYIFFWILVTAILLIISLVVLGNLCAFG